MKVNPELLPLIEWWEKDGKQTLIYLIAAAVIVGGWYGWKGYRAAQKEAAGNALASAYTTEELEEAASKYSNTATAGALKLRLAKNYYDNGNYESALATYEGLIGKAPDGFADVPVVGKAQCLEALGKYGEAQKAFDAFATNAANTNSYLKLTAQLGAVRCLCLGGDKKTALARVDALKAACKEEDAIAKARIEQVESLVKRYEKPAPAPAVKPAEEKAEAAKPAAPAKPAAAPAKPAAPAAKK